MNIIICDDEQVRHDTFEKHLTQAGHIVLHAFGSEECLEIIQSCQEPIGAMMLDHDMPPGKNGSLLATDILNLSKVKWPARVIIHSLNSQGALNIISKFQGAGIHTIYMPFMGDTTAQRVVSELVEQ